MKRILLLLLLMLIFLTGCAQKLDGDGMVGKTTYIQIDQEKAKEMMAVNDGHVVVDVRRADEYASGHIPGAILIPNESIGTEKLIYVTTAGGPIISDEYGYGYVKTLAQSFYGISDVCQVKAEGLDVIGADEEGILNKALEGIRV